MNPCPSPRLGSWWRHIRGPCVFWPWHSNLSSLFGIVLQAWAAQAWDTLLTQLTLWTGSEMPPESLPNPFTGLSLLPW